MELRHLRYFVAVAEEKNFSRAAERIRIAQPALSKQIQALEGELGARLFERRHRGVELTLPGRALLSRARRLLALAVDAQGAIRAMTTRQSGTLRIAFNASAHNDALDAALDEFRRARPEIELSLLDLPSGAQVQALLTGKADLCLGLDLPEGRNIRSVVMLRDQLMAVVPRDHPLASADKVPAAALASNRLLLLRREVSQTMRRSIWHYCRAHGVRNTTIEEFTTIPAGLRLVSTGRGIAMAPGALAAARHRGSVFKPLSPAGPALPWHLYWRTDRNLELVETVVAFVRKNLG